MVWIQKSWVRRWNAWPRGGQVVVKARKCALFVAELVWRSSITARRALHTHASLFEMGCCSYGCSSFPGALQLPIVLYCVVLLCRHYVNSLVQYTTGVERSTQHLKRHYFHARHADK